MTSLSVSSGARSALRDVPYMGVIHVVAEAVKLGFYNGHPDWCNLGQGQPEVGEMAGAPERIQSVELDPGDAAYGPLEGITELREAGAAHDNRLFRKGKASQYTAANVAIASGGRLALTRAAAALGAIEVGYQLPDYTAYEDMFNLHLARLHPVALRGDPERGFAVSVETLERAAREQGLGAFLFSNPCNPTGALVEGDELARYVELARATGMALLSDEFYSHFIYRPDGAGSYVPGEGPVSSAAHVEDVERDPVMIFDGLTKNYRYPGWRIGWVVGPSHMVETTARTGSALDGGPSRLSQRAALKVLEPARADQETRALREVFCAKRNVMVERLKAMGVRFAAEPTSTFYGWGSIADLPAPFNDSQTFFRRALERKVMTVPGEYFDVNPGKRRFGTSPYTTWMRFSFGPPMENLVMGLDRLEEMLKG
jgi:aspartate/methionine/tyrosine aminotransferase